MTFFAHLRTLLWKNVKLRFRKPMQIFAEILWPLFLFIVLIMIKVAFSPSMKIRMDDCFFEDRSLPSAGLYHFLRSYYCLWDSPCFRDVDNGVRVITRNDYNWTSEDELRHLFVVGTYREVLNEVDSFFKVINQLDLTTTLHIFKKSVDNRKDVFLNITDVYILPVFRNLTSNPTNSDVVDKVSIDNSLSNLRINLKELYSTMADYKGNAALFYDYFKNVVCAGSPIFNSSTDQLCRNAIVFTSYFSSVDWLNTFAAVIQQNTEYFTTLELVEFFEAATTYEKVKYATKIFNVTDSATLSVFEKAMTADTFQWEKVFCGPKISLNDNSLLKVLIAKNLFKVDEYHKDFLTKASNISTTEFCDHLFRSFPIIKPLFVGKILYTPENEDVINIIKEANKSYNVLLNTEQFLSNLKILSSVLFTTLTDQNNSMVREIKILAPFLKFFGNSVMFKFMPSDLTFYTILKEKMDHASLIMSCLAEDRFILVKNEMDLRGKAIPFINNKTFLAGLVFDIKKSNNMTIPFMNYKIIVDHYFIKLLNKFNMRESTEFTILHLNARVVPAFIRSGFVYIQDIIDHAFIRWYTGIDDIGTTLQQFPSPCHIENVFHMVNTLLLPLFMVLSWLTFIPIIVKDIVKEKELKLNEFMKIMGVSQSVQWLAWFIYYFFLLMVSVLLMTFLIKIGNILTHSSISLFIVFMMLFMTALITQCFVYSVFFKHSNTAAAFSAIFYFISFLPYKFCANFQSTLNVHYKILTSLSFTSAFGFACAYIARYEELEEGIQWSNMFKSLDEDDEFNFGYCMLMMVVDSIIHILITLYIQLCFPGQFGIAKAWYFPLKWVICGDKNKLFSEYTRKSSAQADTINEPVSPSLETGVSVIHLVKKFKTFVAVNNLTAEFYKNQITGFLGHNGAGKTTTMSIITGLYGPTSGTVLVNNMDVTTQIKEIRKIISLCPQHNILYDDLTVMEHLIFYSMLKRLPKDKIKEECNRLLTDLNLLDKMNVNSSFLSGGMKRKLSVGIAYIGSPDVVVLDEPTAGVDAYARRSIWDLIQKYKNNRTTILSTHLMDEADILSDRLIIINKGQVQASGSVMFLKKHFGKGYQLNLSFDKFIDDDSERNKIIDNIDSFLNNYIPGAKFELSSVHGHGISYVLPYVQQDNDNFQRLFDDLNLKKSELHLSNYGLSNTSLETVFIEVNKDKKFNDNQTEMYSFNYNFNVCPPFKPFAGLRLIFIQAFALFKKRYYVLVRSLKLLFCQLVLPPIFLLLMLLLTDYGFKISSDMLNMELHPWLMKHENLKLYTFLRRGANLHWDVRPIENSILNEPWMGNKCMDPSVHSLDNVKCTKHSKFNRTSFRSSEDPKFNVSCSCQSGYKRCANSFSGQPPPKYKLDNEDILQNLTNYDIQRYLVNTQHNFSKTRFGGFEFKSRGTLGFSLSKKILNISESAISLINQILEGFGVYNMANVSAGVAKNLEIIAPRFTTNRLVTVWFNHESPISVVAYTNVLHNALIRAYSDNVGSNKLGLAVYIQSMNITSRKSMINKALEIFPPVTILFSLTIIPTSFLFFLLNEKNTGMMHLQFISGVNSTLYWITNIIWDGIKFFFICVIFFIEFLIFDFREYISYDNAPTFILLIIGYMCAVIPQTYFFFWIFEDPNTGYIFLSSIYFLVGFIPLVITFVLDFIKNEMDQNNFYKILFSVIPQFSLARGLNDLNRNQLDYDTQLTLLGEHNSEFSNPLTTEMVGKYIIALFVFGSISFALFIVIEFFSHKNLHLKKLNAHVSQKKLISLDKDDDVISEEQRILNNPNDTNVLAVMNITKCYRHWSCFSDKSMHTVLAVNDVSFGVLRKECFGLLGVNGAGKTTLFQMLTGNRRPTSGNIYMNGAKITNNIKKAQKLFGYCPQFDALCGFLTVKEHLIHFSRLKGASSDSVKKICEWAYLNLDLWIYKDTLASHLSGGNKRKLSIALALIGNPEVVYLDEPTAGIDPKARKYVWECIAGTIKAGQSVVLTSHSLEECEFLCNRITIMVSGQLKCLGTIQHLKNKFNEGYMIDVKLRDADDLPLPGESYERFLAYMNEHFPEAKLQEHHLNFVKFQLPPFFNDLSWIFRTLSQAKSSYLIDDYSINQTRLEQIFWSFAKQARTSI